MNYRDRKRDTIDVIVTIGFLIGIAWVVVQCATSLPSVPSHKVSRMKHKQGDIVYMKPDSTKAVIDYVGEDTYTVAYMDKHGKRQYVSFVSDLELY